MRQQMETMLMVRNQITNRNRRPNKMRRPIFSHEIESLVLVFFTSVFALTFGLRV
jgi:hypothetical protein